MGNFAKVKIWAKLNNAGKKEEEEENVTYKQEIRRENEEQKDCSYIVGLFVTSHSLRDVLDAL